MSAYKPLIGITAGEIINKAETWAPITHGQSITYVQAVVHAGGVPVILPLVDDEELNRELYRRCDAILFAGGNDVNPVLFGQQPDPSLGELSDLRDSVELRLIRWSLDDKRPVMGICRGMELLNIARGGDLYQDIATMLPQASDHNTSTIAKDIEHVAHTLRLQPDSQFARIVGVQSLGTNTHHHQAIRRLGQGLQAVGWAEDGVIEIIEDTRQSFVIGVQSHPESMEARAVPEWRRFFREFVRQAALRATPAP